MNWQVGDSLINVKTGARGTVFGIINKEDTLYLKELYPDLDWSADWEPIVRIKKEYSATSKLYSELVDAGWRSLAEAAVEMN